MFIYKIISTFFGIGYIAKGSGTVAALACCLLVYLGASTGFYSDKGLLLCSILLLIVGVIVSSKMETSWGKDSGKVVIDEVQGMTTSLLFLPINFITLIGGFVLFRFFDIYKPLYIRRMERFPGGWGVMLDDLLAGLYTNAALQIIVLFFLHP